MTMEVRYSANKRRKILFSLGVLLFGACVWFCMSVATGPQQIEYTSRIDPKTGLRCRFTVDRAWVLDDNYTEAVLTRDPNMRQSFQDAGVVDTMRWYLHPLSPPMRWINAHLLRHSSRDIATELSLVVYHPNVIPETGLFHENPRPIISIGQVQRSEGFLASGQPATIIVIVLPPFPGRIPNANCQLIVKVKNQPVYYRFMAGGKAKDWPVMYAELMHISHTLRIEQAH